MGQPGARPARLIPSILLASISALFGAALVVAGWTIHDVRNYQKGHFYE